MTMHVVAESAEGHEGLLPASVKIGMPHLDLAGLSENWLLRECGHRHWFLLAAAAGRPFPDFRDAAGDQVYAVFRAVAVRGARFKEVLENDDLGFASTLSRISRTQFESRHTLTCRGQIVGEIDMISSFVKRTIAGVNRSVARVGLDTFPFAGEASSSTLAETAAGFWKDSWTEHRGFRRSEEGGHGELIVRPSPSLDFNGAGFLYFASFPSLVDRAEWETFAPQPSLATASRQVFYFGNIEPGDDVVIRVNGLHRRDSGLSHWCTLLRRCDGTKLADIFTDRV